MKFFFCFFLQAMVAHAGGSAADVALEPRVIFRPETKYIGLEIRHVPGDDAPANLWAEFSRRASEIKDTSGPFVGIAGDFESTGTATYAAARQVLETTFVPSGMQILTTPAGPYADFTIIGPISEMWKALDYIYGEWIPRNGYVSNGAGIEIYSDDADVDAPTFELHFLVLLKKSK